MSLPTHSIFSFDDFEIMFMTMYKPQLNTILHLVLQPTVTSAADSDLDSGIG
jgi:hypothetical protein